MNDAEGKFSVNKMCNTQNGYCNVNLKSMSYYIYK